MAMCESLAHGVWVCVIECVGLPEPGRPLLQTMHLPMGVGGENRWLVVVVVFEENLFLFLLLLS